MLSRSYQPALNATLPRWARFALALACVALGTWASFITLRYFEHGAEALEGGEVARSLAVAAALMFVCLEMAAFGMAALLASRGLRATRWKLMGFAGAVLAFECATIILVQHAITKRADLTASAGAGQAAELRASMAAQRATAEGLRVNAAAQSASRSIPAREAGAQALRDALEIERGLRMQAAELAALEAARRPTATEILGAAGALAYAVARGLLVSLGGLVMFGAAGALLRPERSAPGAVRAESGQAGAHGVLPPSAQALPIRFAPGRFAIAAAAPLAAFAPAAPLQAQAAPVPFQAAAPNTGRAATAASASMQARPDAAESTHQAQEPMPRAARPRRSTAATSGGRRDTGTDAADGSRFQRIRAAIKAGTLRPGLNAIQKAEGGSAPVVRRYLAELEREGLIRRHGRGYVLSKSA